MSTEVESNDEEVKPKASDKYKVVSVEKTDPPEGLPAGNWHRYIIGQGGSKIEGLKPGSLKAVSEHAQLVANDLNARAAGGNSTYAARKQK